MNFLTSCHIKQLYTFCIRLFLLLLLFKINFVDAEEQLILPLMIVTDTVITGMRTDTPLRDVPQSIDIRNQQLIEDIGGLQRTDDIAKTVAGVNMTWRGNGGTNIPILNFRGFSNTSGYENSDFLKDGYRKLGSISNTMDLANIEKIEFLKGPSSVLYGKTENLGGVLNFISKRPLISQDQKFDFTMGSDDFYRGSLDVGAPLNSSKKALFRLNAAIETSNNWRDFAHHETKFIAPIFSYQFENGDTFTALLDYTKTRMLGDFGIPITEAFAKIPRTNYFQEPDFDRTSARSVNTLFEYEHFFLQDWSLTLGIASSWLNWSQNYTRFFSKRDPVTELLIDPLNAVRQPNTEHFEQEDRNIEMIVKGYFSLFKMEHDVLFGATYITNDSISNNIRTGESYAVNLLNPAYGQQANFGSDPSGSGNYHIKNVSGFIQDLITLNSQFKLLLGVRYDTITRATEYNRFFGLTGKDKQTDTRFSPRFGLVYQPVPSTSLYASYTSSFAQRINFTLDPNDRYKPEIGEQYEIGIKQALTPDLYATLALYQLTRKNTLLNNNDGNDFSFRQTGEQRSRGLELSLTGKIADFRVTGAYTWIRSEITKDNKLKTGTKRVGVPSHTLDFSGVYSFKGAYKGLELGSGIHYNSSVDVSMPNSFKLPDSIQWDAILSYRFNPNYKVQVNIKNITDRRNYSVTEDFGYITIGEPRTFYATFSADF